MQAVVQCDGSDRMRGFCDWDISMSASRLLLIIGFFTIALASHSAKADRVFLANGDRLTGQVTVDEAGVVTITSDFGGVMSFAGEHVERIESSDGGSRLEASAEMVAAEVATTAPEPPPRNWDANVDLSTMISRGNTDSQTTNLQAGYRLMRGDHRYSVDVSSIREEENGDTSKEQDELDLGYRYLFKPKWFFAVSTIYERDPIADLDRRISVSPALGYLVWEEEGRVLDFQFGAGYAQEKVGGGDESTSFVEWRLSYEQDIFSDSMEVFHRHKIQRDLSSRKNTAFNSETGFRYDLIEGVYLNVQLNYDYDTEPAAGKEKDDLTFLVGAGVDF